MTNLAEKTVEILGGPVETVRALNPLVDEDHRVTYQAVQKWVKTGQVSPRFCLPIQRATGGRVTAVELRPDIFGVANA